MPFDYHWFLNHCCSLGALLLGQALCNLASKLHYQPLCLILSSETVRWAPLVRRKSFKLSDTQSITEHDLCEMRHLHRLESNFIKRMKDFQMQ